MRRRAWRGRLAGALLACAAATSAAQEPGIVASPPAAPAGTAPPPAPEARPLLEIGGILGGAWLPDYPGSDEERLRVLPAPFVIYRGLFLRSDERGLRGRFLRRDRVELALSASGSLPVSSDDNEARDGMPDLDLLGEIGPNLRLRLAELGDTGRLDLDLGLRAVFSTDFSEIVYRGLVAAPEVSYRRIGLLRPGSRLRLGLGPILASGRAMDYFYDVEPRFARPDRRAYEADAGYLGTRLQGSFSLPATGWLSLFAGARLDLLQGATNEDSPLFRQSTNLAGILGVSFSVYQSSARAVGRADGLE